MAGHSLTKASTLMCPHGGTVQIISSNTRTRVEASFMATATDTFIVVGCPYQQPVPTPSPCVTVRWLVPDSRVKINGNPSLSRSCTGMCLNAAQVPQGPVIVVNTQTRTQSM